MHDQDRAAIITAPPELTHCRDDFPSLGRTGARGKLAYFDGPGGSQVPQQVIDAVSHYYATCNANTHGMFVTSRESDEVLEGARRNCAAFLNAEGAETISFGANMTTLNFMLSRALGRAFQPTDEILITQLDHEANRGPWLRLREMGMTVREVRMLPEGVLDYDDFASKIGERTRLVAVGWASNALGTVNDLDRIRHWSRAVGALLLVDAVHYAPHFSIDVREAGIDFLLCSAYKFYGPHVGILYARPNLLAQFDTDRLRTQEGVPPYRIETGTLNHAAIAGVGAAVKFIAGLGGGENLRSQVTSGMARVTWHEQSLARHFYEELRNLSSIHLYGPDFESGRRAPTISFTVEGRTPGEVAAKLAEKDLLVWDGDFYAARAVEMLGLADRGGLVRVGMSMYTTREEVDRLVEALAELG
ncbi:MAG: cysteine desulfurase-like protein [Acidobacteriota bacterium]